MDNNITIIKDFIYKNLNSQSNIFDCIINEIENKTTNSIAHTIDELKLKFNKKIKGDYFEALCWLYIKFILKHDEVWLYKDISLDIKQLLNLTINDYGIDIVSKKDNEYYAIQCKYRKPNNKIQIISWRSLSTFYGLVSKTGPWKRHIVMTNVNGCKHIGQKTEKDLSICIGTFRNLTHFDWLKMINKENEIKNEIKLVDKEEIRLKRLEYYNK